MNISKLESIINSVRAIQKRWDRVGEKSLPYSNEDCAMKHPRCGDVQISTWSIGTAVFIYKTTLHIQNRHLTALEEVVPQAALAKRVRQDAPTKRVHPVALRMKLPQAVPAKMIPRTPPAKSVHWRDSVSAVSFHVTDDPDAIFLNDGNHARRDLSRWWRYSLGCWRLFRGTQNTARK